MCLLQSEVRHNLHSDVIWHRVNGAAKHIYVEQVGPLLLHSAIAWAHGAVHTVKGKVKTVEVKVHYSASHGGQSAIHGSCGSDSE